MKTAVLFPGQGSQYLGMGREFIENDSECAALVGMAEAICEQPLASLIASGPMEDLTRNAILQPAITLTNMICWQAFSKAINGLNIDCFAGHSLGEYSALYAAGVLSAENTLRLVAKRGSLMEREGAAQPGGMRAVLGLEIDLIEACLAAYKGPGEITAANHNTPQQVVLSGSIVALDAIGPLLEEKGAKIIPLNVSVANHSPLVAKAVPEFAEFMADIAFLPQQTPVYFNVSAGRENDQSRIKEMMANQIASRVRWCEIITAMLAEGVDTFIEVGPKTVLKGMMKKIVPKGQKVTVLNCESPESLDQCLTALA